MKIDIPERDFILAVEQALHRPRTRSASALFWPRSITDSLKERLGLEFKPEEPELPERLGFKYAAFLRTGIAVPDESGSRRALPHEECEAVACYNTVRNILDRCRGHIHVDHVRRTLAKERERLQ